MKAVKYFFSIAFLLAIIAGCKKEVNDDLSLLDSDAAPDNLSAIV